MQFNFIFKQLINCILENPIDQIENYRIEVLAVVKQLQTLDKDKFTAEDFEEANSIIEERNALVNEQQEPEK